MPVCAYIYSGVKVVEGRKCYTNALLGTIGQNQKTVSVKALA